MTSLNNVIDGQMNGEHTLHILPDYIKENLDMIVIGLNPSLTSAQIGHYFAGPGNHFWSCMSEVGLVPEPVTCYDDSRMVDYGIGFTNACSRPTKGAADLSKKELKEGMKSLLMKLQRYNPKIVVFNGKGTYEIFIRHKHFGMGKQPNRLEGTNSVIFVMPSSSARCAQLPRAADKIPFFAALKQLRDRVRNWSNLSSGARLIPIEEVGRDNNNNHHRDHSNIRESNIAGLVIPDQVDLELTRLYDAGKSNYSSDKSEKKRKLNGNSNNVANTTMGSRVNNGGAESITSCSSLCKNASDDGSRSSSSGLSLDKSKSPNNRNQSNHKTPHTKSDNKSSAGSISNHTNPSWSYHQSYNNHQQYPTLPSNQHHQINPYSHLFNPSNLFPRPQQYHHSPISNFLPNQNPMYYPSKHPSYSNQHHIYNGNHTNFPSFFHANPSSLSSAAATTPSSTNLPSSSASSTSSSNSSNCLSNSSGLPIYHQHPHFFPPPPNHFYSNSTQFPNNFTNYSFQFEDIPYNTEHLSKLQNEFDCVKAKDNNISSDLTTSCTDISNPFIRSFDNGYHSSMASSIDNSSNAQSATMLGHTPSSSQSSCSNVNSTTNFISLLMSDSVSPPPPLPPTSDHPISAIHKLSDLQQLFNHNDDQSYNNPITTSTTTLHNTSQESQYLPPPQQQDLCENPQLNSTTIVTNHSEQSASVSSDHEVSSSDLCCAVKQTPDSTCIQQQQQQQQAKSHNISNRYQQDTTHTINTQFLPLVVPSINEEEVTYTDL